MDADDPVLLEVKGGVATISLNRPDHHNVMGEAEDALFFRYLDLLRTDRDVRVVVWRGNGPSFSAGRDLTGETNGDGDGVAGNGAGNGNGNGHHHGSAADLELLERGLWSTRLLYEFPVPIVCALKGWCLGTMLERALLCDIRVAGEGAKLALPGVDHGLVADSAGLAKLFEIGGSGLALDLALTGRRLDAAEALRLGLVSQVVADDDLDEVALDLARTIAERPPLVVRFLREHVQALAAGGVRGTLGRELVGQAFVLGSHDYREHRQARAEDREPRYERR
ncbi:MAG TPA: enoyl-CoA hydratase/isomerase family protein [Acidimicrobiales bacterium]|nr:enoyl-CoA hydratase/isomerase family protein [Acidimicrobiales bacterium]